jgi:two-component system, chemotaxis family, sensor kinase Cph1
LPSEVEGAVELRNAVLGIVLRKAEEMASLNVELQRSNRELEAFSYSVSHDLRAPLRHIVGYAELLKEVAQGKLPEGDIKHADTIIESSIYAGKLVDNLLAYSRMGRTSLERSRIDMNVLVRDVQRDVATEFPGRHVRWNVGPLPTVDADLMMLKLAVRNLLANAVKYTKNRDEAYVEVGCQTDADAHVFHVKDNGVGFDMRYRDKLFGVFQRLHRWEDFEGTGIGLANVRRIVERHGGRTWAEGKVNQGATFYFTLPVPQNRGEE